MKKYLKPIALILTVMILVVMSGCSSIITKEDLEDLEDQISELENQLEDLEDEVDELKESGVTQTAQVSDDATASETADENAEETAENQDSVNETTTQTDMSGFDEDAVLEMLEITEYVVHSDYSSYVLLVIKNNSPYNITLYGEMVFKDGEGSLVGTVSSQMYAFEAGQETLMDFYSGDEFSAYEYSLSAEEETYYAPVISSLEKEVSMTDSKAVLSVTNNGDKAAEFVQFYALFFSGDDLVYYDWGYCTDNDSEIKPGKTNYAEARSYETFDSVLVYLSGRAEK